MGRDSSLGQRHLLTRACGICFLLAGFAFVGGCQSSGNPVDPWEKSNRAMYKFNDGLDRVILEPFSKAYVKYIPLFIRQGIGNGFENLMYLDVILNDYLQAEWKQGWTDTKRMAINSTIGVLGFFDVATRWGLPVYENDFGVTLGRWGVKPGPYLVLPLFGPYTARDAPSLLVGALDDPTFWIPMSFGTFLGVKTVQAVDERARMDTWIRFRDAAALDPYVFVREAYLQYREHLIHPNKPATTTDIYAEEDEATTKPTSIPSTQSSRSPARTSSAPGKTE